MTAPREPGSSTKADGHFDDFARPTTGGNGDTCSQVLEAYRPFLLAIAEAEIGAQLRPKLGASDLVQETLMEAHANFGQFKSQREEDLRAWLKTLLINNLIDVRRKFVHGRKRQITRERRLSNSDVRQAVQALAAQDESPERAAVSSEKRAALHSALGRLPTEYSQVIQWRNRDGLSHSEIGVRCGRSADAARMLWNRAIRALKSELDKLGEERE